MWTELDRGGDLLQVHVLLSIRSCVQPATRPQRIPLICTGPRRAGSDQGRARCLPMLDEIKTSRTYMKTKVFLRGARRLLSLTRPSNRLKEQTGWSTERLHHGSYSRVSALTSITPPPPRTTWLTRTYDFRMCTTYPGCRVEICLPARRVHGGEVRIQTIFLFSKFNFPSFDTEKAAAGPALNSKP